MKCFLNRFDHRELPGRRPSFVNADVCKERQVVLHVYVLLWEKELYWVFCVFFFLRKKFRLSHKPSFRNYAPSLHWQKLPVKCQLYFMG